jgi:hypothetical protein
MHKNAYRTLLVLLFYWAYMALYVCTFPNRVEENPHELLPPRAR